MRFILKGKKEIFIISLDYFVTNIIYFLLTLFKKNNFMNDYIYKFNSFVANELISLKDLTILEFGVKEGRSTKIFLQHCKKNGGKLYSIDVNDYKDKFNDSNWTFIQSRDDNFDYLENKLPKKFDVIYLDSLHEADHVEKILYYYFDKLKIGGLFFIDDTSWLPYIRKFTKR